MRTKQFFVELIQVAMGRRGDLSDCPTAEEWNDLFRMATHHAVAAMLTSAFKTLLRDNSIENSKDTVLRNLDVVHYFQWIMFASVIQENNKKVNRRTLKILQLLRDNGMDGCILKGQGLAHYYGDKALLRQSGDIDVWVNAPYRQVLDYVNSVTPGCEFDRKHTDLRAFKDTPVELHFKPSRSSNPVMAYRLRAFYASQLKAQFSHKVQMSNGDGEITAPDALFNSIYVLLHIFAHFFYEGINAKQLMDYHYILMSDEAQSHRREMVDGWKQLGICDFARAVMYVMKHMFGMPDDMMPVAPDEKVGRELMEDVLTNGMRVCLDENGKQITEPFAARVRFRAKRNLRLIRHNILGVIFRPFDRLCTEVWVWKMRRRYGKG